MRLKLTVIKAAFLSLLALFINLMSNAQCTYFIKMATTKGYKGHVLAIRNDSTLWAWGLNDHMQVENSSTLYVTLTQIGTDKDWIDISAGGSFSLAVKSNGTLWAWGVNSFGQLGNGTNTDISTPTQIGTATDWKSVAAGYTHSLALKTDGTAWAWGSNNYCQLGQGSDCTAKNSPVQVGTSTNWAMLSGGSFFSLGLQNDGTVWGWGKNNRGQLGIGSTVDKNVPTILSSISYFVLINAGAEHSMGISRGGEAYAWGHNDYDQLGLGTSGGLYEWLPVRIGTQSDWVSLAPSRSHTIGIRSNGTAWSWGVTDNYLLGTGLPSTTTPRQIGTSTDWESAIAGWEISLAFKKDHTLWSWGRNGTGGLGNSTNTDAPVPQQISPVPWGITTASVNTSVTKLQLRITDYHTTCSNLIARIEQHVNDLALNGNITASVWFEAAQPGGFVKRHYEINPTAASGTFPKKITLYFTQQEFNDFNAVNTIKLPVDAADAANNKANLLVQRYLSLSNNASGLPDSYTGITLNINPDDANIIWNAAKNRWEVSFISPATGGYFVKTQTTSISSTLDKVGLTYPTPAAVAYSLRLLSSAYTGAAVTVRRSSDNATQDVGFMVDGNLDTVTLKNFVGAGNGYIQRWYDQSGNNLSAEQNNTSLQPLIVNTGIIERINGQPAIYFNSTNLATIKQNIFSIAASMVGVAKGNSSTPSAFVTKTGTAAGNNQGHPGPFDFTNAGAEFTVGNANTAAYSFIQAATTTPRSTVNNQVNESVYSFVIPSSGTYYNYVNGVQAGSQAVTAFEDGGNSLMIGNRNDGGSAGNFWTPEIILFNKALSTSDRTIVETSQTTRYLGSTLPLSWLSVKGYVTNRKTAQLTWEVNEYYVAGYQVEKSADGITYTTIGHVDSKGDGTNSYSFTEATMLSGASFYRIKQTDLDGTSTWSTTIKLTNQNVGQLSISPNPTKGIVTISAGISLLNSKVYLYDVNGKKLQSITITNLSFPVSLAGYPAGVYILKTDNGIVERIIKN